MNVALRDKALALLTGDSPILTVAREVTSLCRAHGLGGAVIGGVAVVLHGYVRTTADVDVYTDDPTKLRDVLIEAGYTFDPDRKQFVKDGVPVHLVTPGQVPSPPRTMQEIDAVRTVSLADLIDMKLRSGLRDMLRAQDLADVIGLIRRHHLKGDFTPRLREDVRSEFRKLAGEIERRG